MKHTLRKLFFAWQHEEEENWLNAMSNKGFQLEQVGLISYTFNEGTPGEFIYRLELLENLPSHPESTAYLRFLEETGVEHLGSLLRWVYLRKKAGDGEFNLYSDIDSRIKHFKRIQWLLLVVAIINIPLISSTLVNYRNLGDIRMIITVTLQFLVVALLAGGLFKITAKIKKLMSEKLLRE